MILFGKNPRKWAVMHFDVWFWNCSTSLVFIFTSISECRIFVSSARANVVTKSIHIWKM